jgi:hypothetical protein
MARKDEFRKLYVLPTNAPLLEAFSKCSYAPETRVFWAVFCYPFAGDETASFEVYQKQKS